MSNSGSARRLRDRGRGRVPGVVPPPGGGTPGASARAKGATRHIRAETAPPYGGRMDMPPQDDLPLSPFVDPSLSRRRFLRGAAVAGTGLIAAGLAACAPATSPNWTFGPGVAAPPLTESGSPPMATPSGSMDHSMAPSVAPSAGASPDLGTIPPGWSAHDVEARNTVRRYLGDLVKALPEVYPAPVVAKLAGILGVEDDYPELGMKPAFAQVPQVVLQNAVDAARARDRGRRQDLPPDHRYVPAADRRADAAHRSARLQRPVAGPDHPGEPGRQGPGDLHEQPRRDHRRPLPRRRIRRLLPGRRPIHHPATDRAGRDATRTTSWRTTPAR